MKAATPVILIILAALIMSSVPYYIGWSAQPPGLHFMGLTHNLDDACVYLSWMRQTADGSALIRNQFTTEPQSHLQFNLLFLLLGWIARLFHLPLITVFHGARLVLGAGLLMMVYRFAGVFLERRDQRLAVLLIVSFSSGLGWLFREGAGRTLPVDMWQPEAITFLSLYLNPLFMCAQMLMLASLFFLMRNKSSGKLRDAALAGFCLLLLGNIHTYDVVTVAIVWAAYLAVSSIVERRAQMRVLWASALAALVASPALLYQLYLYRSEEVFRLRANTPAESPPLWAFLAGYGLILALGVVGIMVVARKRQDVLLPAVWSVVGFAIPYLPVAQQRKLIMGLHVPLAILAALALVWLLRKRNISVAVPALIVAIAAIPSNIVFMANDVNLLSQNRTATLCRPYLASTELAAMHWLRSSARRSDSVLAPPDIACFVPALTGNRVYFGHWSETPAYYEKLREFGRFTYHSADHAQRYAYLSQAEVRYLWWDTRLTEVGLGLAGEPVFEPDTEPYLTRVYTAGSIRLYRVKQVLHAAPIP